MKAGEQATVLHESGFNCAQSVLKACSEYTGLDPDLALAISAGFGGGLRCGEVCGAVSGAVMALGLANPFTDSSNKEAKERIAMLARNFTTDFREKFGCLRCQELKSPARCAEMIAFAADLAENVLIKQKNEENKNGDL